MSRCEVLRSAPALQKNLKKFKAGPMWASGLFSWRPISCCWARYTDSLHHPYPQRRFCRWVCRRKRSIRATTYWYERSRQAALEGPCAGVDIRYRPRPRPAWRITAPLLVTSVFCEPPHFELIRQAMLLVRHLRLGKAFSFLS